MEEFQIEDIGEELLALTLSEPEYLLFNPPTDKSPFKEAFGEVPRYLFRVSTSKSDGITNSTWVKSKDAAIGRADSAVDIFARESASVANMLNRHLQWSGRLDDVDNFVSWTSSLLFVLQYIFYRRTSNRLDMRDIFLCIIDTSAFPRATFLKDKDLINTYSEHENALRLFRVLRDRQCHPFKGSYYFGEYLSQGALKVDGSCSIVSAQFIVDQGLFYLQPGLEDSMLAAKTRLAHAVVRLREPFYQLAAKRQQATKGELEAAINIAHLFDRKAEERAGCSPTKTRIWADATLPEVQEFEKIMHSIHMDTCLTRVKNHVEEVKTTIRATVALALSRSSDSITMAKVTQGSEQSSDPAGAIIPNLLEQLKTVADLNQTLVQALCSIRGGT
ncbi:MAG: hypothetical protein LQ348_003743 [Seirophora lacunosa]|nr:MAG: hypothetical protein LQ348_003743 [Seirophora lacunosa]